ncbi:C-type lectin APL-like [Cuculus canorus]|uniref:C-type lectin APL-like n=1 Tax=Cuculus canorus TaxID=55661 RepID=UPI0023AAAD8E|nr:C-type lectin APL-like [Cuculus canorus]
MGAVPTRQRLLGCLLLLAFLGVDSLPADRILEERAGTSILAAAPDVQPYVLQEPPVRAHICPHNWIHFRGHCYGYFTQRKTQAEAQEECSRYGPTGTLASIHTEGSSVVLGEYVASQQDRANVWIGLKDEEHTGTWRWSDSSVLDYLHWDWGQPVQWRNWYCVVLGQNSAFQYWRNYSCQEQFPFLCQYQV